MGERQTPALINQALEARAKAAEIQRVAEQTPIVHERITTLVRSLIPDPALDNQSFYLSSRVSIEFPYTVDDEEVKILLDSPYYPREDGSGQPGYVIRVEEVEGEIVIPGRNKGEMLTRYGANNNPLFDQVALNNLSNLLQGIEDGLRDGSIKPWIHSPRPETRNLIDLLIEDQHVAPLG